MTDNPFSAPSGAAVPPPPPLAAPPLASPPPPPAGYGYAYAPPPGGPYVAPYGPSYGQATTAKNWMGIASLVLSLATVVFGFTCIGGIILGHLGLAAAKRGEANNRGLALAGVIVGWVLLGLGVLFVGAIVVFSVAFSQSTS